MLIGACPPSEGVLRKSKRLKEDKDKQNDEKLAPTKHVPLQNPHFQVYFDGPWKLKRVVGYLFFSLYFLEFKELLYSDLNV